LADRAGARKGRPEASEASMSISEYLPILLFLAVASVLALALLGIGSLLGPRRPGAEKLSPYECGFEAFEDARMRFDVRYYLVAILFIIFDLEIAFLFPWALVFDELGTPAFIAMVVFLGILVIGFIYEWKKGALEWE
jgi:NADH-quinone oxidoreductase subunit A